MSIEATRATPAHIETQLFLLLALALAFAAAATAAAAAASGRTSRGRLRRLLNNTEILVARPICRGAS